MSKDNVKKVHVVFMTHFDMGFTDLAENVLRRYTFEFIPQAVALAKELNAGGEKKFVWTLGAFLISYCLKNGEEEVKQELCAAIERGDIGWHGLAFTTHTELMDGDLLDFDLRYADELDERFGKKTIGTKLTDVPGHTKAIIPYFAAHHKKYLHIGVNQSSMLPVVPPTFLWKSGDTQLVVQYSDSYGSTCYVEGMSEVLEFVFLGDNLGIPTKEAVLAQLYGFRKKYPKAAVEAATLDAYGEALWKIREELPVITEEIGDSWIHGAASDPVKTACLRRLLELKDKWKRDGIFEAKDPAYHEFLENLLMVCEHTWALDFKKYLFDFTNWTKEDFRKARKSDRVTDELFTNRNAALQQAVFTELGVSDLQGSYSFYESSYKEQRNYLKKAVESLPKDRRAEAEEIGKQLYKIPAVQLDGGEKCHPWEEIRVGDWKVAFDGSGAVVMLEADGKNWAQNGYFGRLSYETYSALECVADYYDYNRSFKENMTWSEADFSKPGLETVESLKHKNYLFGVSKMQKQGNKIELILKGSKAAVKEYGCPAQALICYTFGEEIRCQLSWKDKDANKMPEALWFDCNLGVDNPYLWQMSILGKKIRPFEVVAGGNRKQHCVEKLTYQGADGKIKIINRDSPLVSMGGRRLYGSARELPDMRKGFSYCLFNNKWGTNFPMWCEDNCFFEYVIKIKNHG